MSLPLVAWMRFHLLQLAGMFLPQSRFARGRRIMCCVHVLIASRFLFRFYGSCSIDPTDTSSKSVSENRKQRFHILTPTISMTGRTLGRISTTTAPSEIPTAPRKSPPCLQTIIGRALGFVNTLSGKAVRSSSKQVAKGATNNIQLPSKGRRNHVTLS